MAISNNKNIAVIVDSNSWNPGVPPAPLVAAQTSGQFDLNLTGALIFIAICTRPPTRLGFTLSDCWAWLRYFPAFVSGSDLRLCKAWSDIDPHQKTVSSDDFGVGITTWFLHNTLDFQVYSDTSYVMKVLEPGMWTSKKIAKRGPSKSPDYIAKDSSGNLSILECKGTQTSIGELYKAVSRGLEQKTSVSPAGKQKVLHKLVAGAFVPQFNSREQGTILISDPDWREIEDEFSRHSIDNIRASTDQVYFAKEISMFDLNETSAYLVGDEEQQAQIPLALDRDIDLRKRTDGISNDVISYARDHFWNAPVVLDETEYVGVRYKASLDLEHLFPLRSSIGDLKRREIISEAISGRKWEHPKNNMGSGLVSPIGAKYEIEWLPR